MQNLLLFVKGAVRINSPLFLLFFVGVCLVLMSIRRLSRFGRGLLVAGIVTYAFLATPFGSRLITAPLARGYTQIADQVQAPHADVIVLLGGGIRSYRADGLVVDDLRTSALRVLETARLFKLLGPRVTIVSGGNAGEKKPPRSEADAFKNALIGLGVPADRILVENQSHNTRDEALLLRPMLESLGARRFILVTSPVHMWRSMRVFQAQRLDPIPAPAALASEGSAPPSLLPNREALDISDTALYEYSAIVYYWLRGWL